jgi:hypothetical protein
MAKYRSGRISVDIDVSDVIEEIDDEYLIEEAKKRDLLQSPETAPQPYVKDYVTLAHEELMAGRAASALALLDRALFPTGAEKSDGGQLVFKRSA